VSEFLPIGVALSALVIFLLSHIVIWQFESIDNRGVLLITLVAILSYLLAAGGYSIALGEGASGQFWVSCPIFMLLIMAYLHFFAGITRSVSIRILGELVKTPEGRLSLVQLYSAYPKEYTIRHRVDLLVESGWLSVEDGMYRCTVKGSFISRCMTILQRLYSIESVG